MPSATTPTSLIEAVNIILDGIGEAPINSLISDNEDVNKALARIDEASRDIQGYGLWFNTETTDISPDGSGEYPLTPDVITAKAVNFLDRHFVIRGSRMYDRKNARFNSNTEDLKVELIRLLDFDDLPEEARRAVFVQAARKFGDRIIGSTVLHQLLSADEGSAQRRLMSRNLEMERWNSLDSPTTSKAVLRRRI